MIVMEIALVERLDAVAIAEIALILVVVMAAAAVGTVHFKVTAVTELAVKVAVATAVADHQLILAHQGLMAVIDVKNMATVMVQAIQVAMLAAERVMVLVVLVVLLQIIILIAVIAERVVVLENQLHFFRNVKTAIPMLADLRIEPTKKMHKAFT